MSQYEATQKTFTVTLTERQIRNLETYVLSQEIKESHQSKPEIVEFYSNLFITLSSARLEKQL